MHPLEIAVFLLTWLSFLVVLTDFLKVMTQSNQQLLYRSKTIKDTYRKVWNRTIVFPDATTLATEKSLELDIRTVVEAYPKISASEPFSLFFHQKNKTAWEHSLGTSKYQGAVLLKYRPFGYYGVSVMRKGNIMFGFYSCDRSQNECQLHTSIYYCGTFLEDQTSLHQMIGTIAPIVEYTKNITQSETILKNMFLVHRYGDSDARLSSPWNVIFRDINMGDLFTTMDTQEHGKTLLQIIEVSGFYYQVNKGVDTISDSGSKLAFDKYVLLEEKENGKYWSEVSFSQYEHSTTLGIGEVLSRATLVFSNAYLAVLYCLDIFLGYKAFGWHKLLTSSEVYVLANSFNGHYSARAAVIFGAVKVYKYSDGYIQAVYHDPSTGSVFSSVFFLLFNVLSCCQEVLLCSSVVAKFLRLRINYRTTGFFYVLNLLLPLLVGNIALMMMEKQQNIDGVSFEAAYFHRSIEELSSYVSRASSTAKVGPKSVMVRSGTLSTGHMLDGASGEALIISIWTWMIAQSLFFCLMLVLKVRHIQLKRSKDMSVSDKRGSHSEIMGEFVTKFESAIEMSLYNQFGILPEVDRRIRLGEDWAVTENALLGLGFCNFGPDLMVDRSFVVHVILHYIGLANIYGVLFSPHYTIFTISEYQLDAMHGKIVFFGSQRWNTIVSGKRSIDVKCIK